MLPPARIDRALTSSGVNPTWGLMIVVAARSAAVIYVLHIVDHLFPLKTAVRCVSGGQWGRPGEYCAGGTDTVSTPFTLRDIQFFV